MDSISAPPLRTLRGTFLNLIIGLFLWKDAKITKAGHIKPSILEYTKRTIFHVYHETFSERNVVFEMVTCDVARRGRGVDAEWST